MTCNSDNLFVYDQGGGPPPLDSDLDWGAGEEANSPAGGARRGLEELWWEGFNFHQDQDFDSNTPAFSGREGLFARCLGLCAHSRGLLRSRIFDVEFQLVIFLTFTFLQSSFLIVVY